MAKATKKEQPITEFQEHTPVTMVPLADIIPDASQPRKNFNEVELNELADSIKKHGVLQPIIVRPLFGMEDPTRIIVFGERRYRASLLAGLPTIPAFVKQMSAEEALELQIIENLQRKDVHPMEEAKAFKYLNDHGKNIVDIAGKVGKSTKYVAARLKLTDLLPVFQQAYMNGFMDYSDAKLICKQTGEVQVSLHAEVATYENDTNNDEETPAAYLRRVANEGLMLEKLKLGNIDYYLNDLTNRLDKATFDTIDKNLFPEMGSCTYCNHNSSNTPLLFMEEDWTCNNAVCFTKKTSLAFQNNLKELATDPNMLFIYNSYGNPYDKEKKLINDAKALGIKVLNRDDYMQAPDDPGDKPIWENYFKEKWEEMDDEDRADGGEDTIREWFMDEVEEWEEDKKTFDSWNSGDIRKAFVVAGQSKGEVISIVLKLNKSNEPSSQEEGGEQSDEVSKILSREARAKELDGEKVWENIRQLLTDEGNRKQLFQIGKLSETEREAFAEAIYNKVQYQHKGWVKEQFSEKKGSRFEKITELGLNQLARILIMDVLITPYGSHLRDGSHNQLAYEIVKTYLPEEVAKIELEQQEKAAARNERVTKRIEALQKKID